MKTIIVCTDFSATSVNAALYATHLALFLEARVLLFHVNTPQESFNQSPVFGQAEAELKSAQEQLENIVQMMSAAAGYKSEISKEIAIGDFFTELHAICNKIEPFAVIMGSQGSTATERFLLGSNSVHAMKTLHWPLLTIPAGATYKPVERIGLASDFDNVVQTLPIERIERIINNFNASLHIINVSKNSEMSAEAKLELGLMQEMLNSLHPQYHFITRASIQDGILDFTEANSIDLLLIFPKQYGFLEDLFHKSMSKQLLLNCKVPLAVLHPKEQVSLV